MTAEYAAHLYEYDNYQNREVLTMLRELQERDTKARDVFAHILQTKKIWLWRMEGKDYKSLNIWPELTWEECGKLLEENHKDWAAFIGRLRDDDLLQNVVFQDSEGVEYHMPVRDILTHVLIHGGYHRGQIAQTVRSVGGEPVNTDYIRYARKLEVES